MKLSVEIDNRTIAAPVISGEIIDSTGFTADSCNVILANEKGDLTPPEIGMKVNLAIELSDGFESIGSEYTVTGTTDTEKVLIINAKSIDITRSLKKERGRSYHGATLAEVFKEVATQNGLDVLISPEVSAIKLYNDVVQLNETDLNFLTRICKKYDLFFKQKKGKIAFGSKSGKSDFTGEKLTPVFIYREEIDPVGWSYTRSEPDKYSSVKVGFYDLKNGTVETLVIGDESREQYVIKERFRSEAEARLKAEAELKKFKGRDKTLSLILPKGKASIFAEGIINVPNLRDTVNGEFTVNRVQHNIAKGGLTTQLTARAK